MESKDHSHTPIATTDSSLEGNTASIPRRRKRAPGDYSNAIVAHSARAKERSLTPGSNYRSLVQYLNSSHSKKHSRPLKSLETFTAVAVHDLVRPLDDKGRYLELSESEAIDRFESIEAPMNGQGQLIFVRGYPAPRLITLLGARYSIDPEFFRRHVTFGPTKDFFDLPGLPSSSENSLELRVPSIGRCNPTTSKDPDGGEACYKHFQCLGSTALWGESIVRNFNWHDEEHFTIEQRVSINIVKKRAGWIALVLLDNGRDLDQGPSGPWFRSFRQNEEIFLPVFQAIPGVPLSHPNAHLANSQVDKGLKAATQSNSLLGTSEYSHRLNPDVMAIDAFYALTPLFIFCASAEIQYLNLLRSKIETEFAKFNIRDETFFEKSLETFRRHRLTLLNHIEYLERVKKFVTEHEHSLWPRAVDENHQQVVERATKSVVMDFTMLHELASVLVGRCEDGIEDARSNFMLSESRRATESAYGLSRLTFLAFFFVPVSFTSTFFGMNVKELGQGALSIWAWFALSVPVFLVALAVCFWDKISRRFARK